MGCIGREEEPSEEDWAWYRKVKKAGQEYVKDIPSKTHMAGMIGYEEEKNSDG